MISASDHHFAIIGAGGLGGPIAYSLAAAGAGGLTIIDDDLVELSNLQRQIQFCTRDIGTPKASAMKAELQRRGYPLTKVRALQQRFTAENATELLHDATVVLDGSDNFTTKFAVNDAAVAAGLPVVIGGVLRYSGQALAVAPGTTGCYRCLFEAPPPDGDVDACSTAGVLGAAVAVIAGHCARLALVLAAGGTQGVGVLHVFDDLSRESIPRHIAFRQRQDCPACSQQAADADNRQFSAKE